jgi:CelD/BcsL family acetyltransferase involved in cellulose biosynthesis
MPGLFFSAKNRQFHLKLAKKLLAEKRLLLAELTADQTPIASLYGFKFKETVYYYLGGFDPNWSKHSPLSLLLIAVIKQSIEQGYKSFDFLRGREPYKEKWGATAKPMLRLIVYRPSVKG